MTDIIQNQDIRFSFLEFLELEEKKVIKDLNHILPKAFPRSPLRYPGGKNRAIKTILPLIPSDTTVLCSPFLGGGPIELAASTKMEVHGFDIFEPLVDFWQMIQKSPEK